MLTAYCLLLSVRGEFMAYALTSILFNTYGYAHWIAESIAIHQFDDIQQQILHNTGLYYYLRLSIEMHAVVIFQALVFAQQISKFRY